MPENHPEPDPADDDVLGPADQPNPWEIEGVNSRAPQPGQPMGAGWKLLARLAMLTVLALLVVIFSPLGLTVQKKLGRVPQPTPAEEVVPPAPKIVKEVVKVEVVKETRTPYYRPEPGMSVSKTSRGFDFKSGIRQEDGGLTSSERKRDGSYEANYTITVSRPRAADSLADLEAATPSLSKVLPGMADLLNDSKVSPFYKTLYDYKAKRIRDKADDFSRLLTKHNYYDCQTMLEMTHATSGRKVFLFQGDMDVVADGSDGDRLPSMKPEVVTSTYYQPFTSYSWPKVGSSPNPMIAGWQGRIGNAKRELGQTSTDANRKSWLRGRIKELENGISEMKRRSYLLARFDPFIVVPSYVIRDRESPFGPNAGDYAAVVYEGKIYPAIVGDAGPNFKVGEASLRMAQTINKKATPNYRPVSSVGVTYLVFPRTSVKKWVEPDYAVWREKVSELIQEIGGLGEGIELYDWGIPPATISRS